MNRTEGGPGDGRSANRMCWCCLLDACIDTDPLAAALYSYSTGKSATRLAWSALLACRRARLEWLIAPYVLLGAGHHPSYWLQLQIRPCPWTDSASRLAARTKSSGAGHPLSGGRLDYKAGETICVDLRESSLRDLCSIVFGKIVDMQKLRSLPSWRRHQAHRL